MIFITRKKLVLWWVRLFLQEQEIVAWFLRGGVTFQASWNDLNSWRILDCNVLLLCFQSKSHRLTKTDTWSAATSSSSSFCLIDEDKLLIRSRTGVNAKYVMRVCDQRTGDVLNEIISECDHHCSVLAMANRPQALLEGCRECQHVKMYDANGERVKMVYQRYNSRALCAGPEGSVLILEDGGLLRKLSWSTGNGDLQVISSIETEISRVRDMCYVEKHSIVSVIAPIPCNQEICVKGLNAEDGSTVWTLTECARNIPINPIGICYDSSGQIYVIDIWNERLLLVDGGNGRILKTSSYGVVGSIWEILCTGTGTRLLTWHDGESKKISCYKLK